MKGLYVHIPFCINKCPYCDFNSYAGRENMISPYFSYLKKEAAEFAGEKICTVYIGGGTPSMVGEEYISDIMEFFRENFEIEKDAEITIEANPATLTEKKIETYLKSGINRISIGVQSFDDAMLKTLGRIHSSAEAKEAVMLAAEGGFKNISCDLMFALPGQTLKSLQADLKKAMALPVTHISCYGLKIEEGTPFFRKKVQPADEDVYTEMYGMITEILSENGFEKYEISNFAKNGKKSQHNLLYWHCREYIGIGAGAHSYVCGRRYSNPENIEEYMANKPKENIEILTGKDMLIEKLIMGMRLSEGVEKSVAEALGGGGKLKIFIENGFIQEKNSRISFTPKGINVSNYILSELI